MSKVSTLTVKDIAAVRPIAAPLPSTQQVAAKSHHHHSKHDHDHEDDEEEERERERDHEHDHDHDNGHHHHGHHHHDGKKTKKDKSKSIKSGLPETTKTVGCNMDEYIHVKITKYMTKKGLCRFDAVKAALAKAQNKGYPALDDGADAGRGYPLVMAALERKSFDLKIGSADAAGQHVAFVSADHVQRSDDELHVSFQPHGQQMEIPLMGFYELKTSGGGGGSSTCGHYDLASRGIVAGSGCRFVSMPLYRESKVEHMAEHCLPHCELRAVVEPLAHAERARVHSAMLVIHGRPNVVALLDGRPSAHCATTGRVALPPSHYMFGYESAEEQRAAQCVTRPGELSDAVGRILEARIGKDQAHTFRFVSHVEKQLVCQVGRTPESHKHFYRLGHVTETVVATAVLAHILECTPPDMFGRTIDLHQAKLTEFLLTRAGALSVLRGLKAAYACVGRGELPSPYHLLNHVSGLPDHFDSSAMLLQHVFADKAAVGGGGVTVLDADKYEVEFGASLEKSVRVLHAPAVGAYHHSHLAYAVLRFMLPDWKESSLHTSKFVMACATELGMPTLCFPGGSPNAAQIAASHAPSGSLGHKCVPTMHAEPESPLQLLSTGASCRVDEFAAFLAGSGPVAKHSWQPSAGGGGGGSDRYMFLAHMQEPRTCISRHSMVYHGYGFDHVSLPCKAFGAHGLRALIRVGYTPTHHSFVICLVPALSLSFALGTSADINLLCDSVADGSVIPLLTDLVSAHHMHLSKLESANQMRPVELFHRRLNEQLLVPPAPGVEYAQHVRYSASKTAMFMKRDSNLDTFCGTGASERFLSITDIRHSVAALRFSRHTAPQLAASDYHSPVSLSVQYNVVSVASAGKDKDKKALSVKRAGGGVYTITETYAHGVSVSHMLAYDHDAFRSAEHARNALEAHSKHGTPLANRGMYRVLSHSDGLLSEFVEFLSVDLISMDGKQQQTTVKASVICFRGRVFVRGGLYELIRKSLAPRHNERLMALMNDKQQQQQQHRRRDLMASAALSSSDTDEDEVGDDEDFGMKMVNSRVKNSAVDVAGLLRDTATVPSAKQIGPHYGGGSGGYGRGYGGGAYYRPAPYYYGAAPYGAYAMGALTGAAVAGAAYGGLWAPGYPGYAYGGYAGAPGCYWVQTAYGPRRMCNGVLV